MSEPSGTPLAILEARHVTKTYHRGEVAVHALAGIDLTVAPAEFVAIMGPSGSGKSTLLYLLGGLDRPTSGEVFLRGQPFSPLSDDEITLIRRRHIGFVFQFYNLVPTLTAAENAALPLIIDGADVARLGDRIDALLDAVGLAARRHHRPDQLSGGEQQRVAIARALATKPAVVLADEPTGNLDSASGTEILSLLRTCSTRLGQTIVMVTHDSVAAGYADRVVLLEDGAVVGKEGAGRGDRRDARARRASAPEGGGPMT